MVIYMNNENKLELLYLSYDGASAISAFVMKQTFPKIITAAFKQLALEK